MRKVGAANTPCVESSEITYCGEHNQQRVALPGREPRDRGTTHSMTPAERARAPPRNRVELSDASFGTSTTAAPSVVDSPEPTTSSRPSVFRSIMATVGPVGYFVPEG
jgi:hypothetical protein